MIFGHIEADEICDWHPSRFQEKPEFEAKAETGEQITKG
jgi:hypothetical protein